jgi:hypothetical protein
MASPNTIIDLAEGFTSLGLRPAVVATLASLGYEEPTPIQRDAIPGIDARAIGAVDIADRFSLVEVPDEAVDEIIGALRNTTIRGKRVIVRRDKER